MPYQVRYEWQAQAAINSLSPEERCDIDHAIQRLQEGRFDEVPVTYRVAESEGFPEVNVLRAGKVFRIIFTIEPGDVVVVQDVINKNFARRYG